MRARDNPFASHHIDALEFRPQGTSWDALLTRLDGLGGRGAIVGPHGSGKTTLLEALGARLSRQGFRTKMLRLEGWGRPGEEYARFLPGDAVLVDGLDRLGALAWFRLRRRACRASVLVATSHREERLPTLHRCGTSAALLANLVASLAGGTPAHHLGLARALHQRHGGDVRAALRELYDRASRGTIAQQLS